MRREERGGEVRREEERGGEEEGRLSARVGGEKEEERV